MPADGPPMVRAFRMKATMPTASLTVTMNVGGPMTQQDDINADVAAIEQGVSAINTAATAIAAEIAALKAANPSLDLSGLDQAATDLANAVAGITALEPPPA